MWAEFKKTYWAAFVLFPLTLTSISAGKREETEILLNEINGFVFSSMETLLFVWM